MGFEFFLIVCYILGTVESGKVKVVDAPFSFHNPLGSNGHPQPNQEKKLLLRFDPEEPSGPLYLIEKLTGKCFNLLHNNYKYEFCPFQNVTQREQTFRWNSYHGVLGVWKHWSVEDGLFKQMEMMHGDICMGTLERQVSVVLKCGEKDKIISVTEPETCKYRLIFKTPYACPTDVFQVYPALSEGSRNEWLALSQKHRDGILTKKGFEKRQKKILIREGLHKEEKESNKQATISPVATNSIDKDSKEDKEGSDTSSKTRHFISRHQCIQAYEKLQEESTELRERIRILETNQNETSNITTSHVGSDISTEEKIGPQRDSGTKPNSVEPQQKHREKQHHHQDQHQHGDKGLIDEDANSLKILPGQKIEEK